MKHYSFLLLILLSLFSYGQEEINSQIITGKSNTASVSKNIFLFLDSTKTKTIQEISEKTFSVYNGKVVNLGITDDVVWLKFSIKNTLNEPFLYIKVAQPIIDSVSLFERQPDGSFIAKHLGEYKPFRQRFTTSPDYLFPVSIEKGHSKTFYVRVSSTDQIQLPISVGTRKSILEQEAAQNLYFGIYIGVVFIMAIYNLFVFITVKDKAYIYYIIYILFVGLTQCVLKGYAFKFLWPNSPAWELQSSLVIPALSGIATGFFMKHFLQTRQLVPKLDKGVSIFIGIYVLALFVDLFVDKRAGLLINQFAAFLGSIFALIVGWVVMKQGLRAAVFFLVAYSVFLVSVVIYVLSSFNILPYNIVTGHVLEVGSALQIALLSFALADKINTYRKETLATFRENERLVRDQNTLLEQQVYQRTQELEKANNSLNNTLHQLRSAQSKLVESEKMASLGQLTAGIAHEINNPINFVTSNIKPLELDINDLLDVIDKYENIDSSQNINDQLLAIEQYKKQVDIAYVNEEIKTLLSGIKDGAHRTAEIVSNLKNFARIDEANVKYVNLNDGLQSTLLLVKNSFPNNFRLNKEFGNIPDVECMPGKINQVFMNIIINGLQAIAERQANKPGQGILTVKTNKQSHYVKVSIKDNGTGIQKNATDKIFDPFYTTKPAGQGTGLGMSIVKGIIDSHSGTIELVSTYGEGAEFIITLPIKYLNGAHSNSPHDDN